MYFNTKPPTTIQMILYKPNLIIARVKNPKAETLSLGTPSVFAKGSLSVTSGLLIISYQGK